MGHLLKPCGCPGSHTARDYVFYFVHIYIYLYAHIAIYVCINTHVLCIPASPQDGPRNRPPRQDDVGLQQLGAPVDRGFQERLPRGSRYLIIEELGPRRHNRCGP